MESVLFDMASDFYRTQAKSVKVSLRSSSLAGAHCPVIAQNHKQKISKSTQVKLCVRHHLKASKPDLAVLSYWSAELNRSRLLTDRLVQRSRPRHSDCAALLPARLSVSQAAAANAYVEVFICVPRVLFRAD
jgi:hypothetical protein